MQTAVAAPVAGATTSPFRFRAQGAVTRKCCSTPPKTGRRRGTWKSYIDRITNVLQFLPDNPVTDTMDAVLTLLKHVALGAVRGLDGLTSMDPSGSYLRTRLNPSTVLPHGQYFAVASNYEPPPGSPLWRVARDDVTDLVFGLAQNDLIVPTDGVYTVPGAGGFPILAPLVFPADAGVEHSGYWARGPFTSQLLQWLTL